MRLHKTILIALFALATVSVSATAAIINQIDFPEVFTAKEKAVHTDQDTMIAANTH